MLCLYCTLETSGDIVLLQPAARSFYRAEELETRVALWRIYDN